MGKKEQVPARATVVQGSLWVWSATIAGVVLPMSGSGRARAAAAI